MRKNLTNAGIVLAGLVLLVLGCSEARNAKPTAEKAISQFHKSLNEGDLDRIYAAADAKFKAATTKADFEKLMTILSDRLGKVTSTANQSWNVRTFNTTTTIQMVQKTQFEKGDATETFTIEVDGENSLLIEYLINSPKLLG